MQRQRQPHEPTLACLAAPRGWCLHAQTWPCISRHCKGEPTRLDVSIARSSTQWFGTCNDTLADCITDESKVTLGLW